MYHEKLVEFEDYTLLSHIGRHIVQNPVQGQHHVTTKVRDFEVRRLSLSVPLY